MKMIIGGACQGKLAYAQKNFEINKLVDGNKCSMEELLTCEAVNHFHECIKRFMQESVKVQTTLAEIMIARNPNMIIISDEVGYGVVPIDKFEREYREAVGRICTKLAQNATEVHRVVCGIGMMIKKV